MNILSHYNELLELHIELEQLIYKIQNKEMQKELVSLSERQLSEIQDLDSIINNIDNNFNLNTFDRTIEVIFIHKKNIIKTKLKLIKEIEKTVQ